MYLSIASLGRPYLKGITSNSYKERGQDMSKYPSYKFQAEFETRKRIRGMEDLDEGYFGIKLDRTGPNRFGLQVGQEYVRLSKAQVAGLISHLKQRYEAFDY